MVFKEELAKAKKHYLCTSSRSIRTQQHLLWCILYGKVFRLKLRACKYHYVGLKIL